MVFRSLDITSKIQYLISSIRGTRRVNREILFFEFAAPDGLAFRLADTVGAAAGPTKAAPGDHHSDGHDKDHDDEERECQDEGLH
jgi:hypothetical protein